MSAISYRKDIDGLRAVAVLLVIFAHAKISMLAGGFIGVDVFFVISGFLITSILKRELDQGTFSFVNFYMRRVRRILPALVFLLIGTTVLSSAILLPADLELFAESSLAGMTAWSNIFFNDVSGGYWGKDISVMPLAHLWSLAVEEQFYFIWPFLLLCLYVYVPKKHFSRSLFGIFFCLLAISVFQAQYPSGYYHLTARAFEIMLGVLIAMERPRMMKLVHRFPSVLVSGAGFGLILFSAFVYEEGISFPGWNALWPCLGAGLLILPPKDSNIITRFLESSPMVYVGKISYSLYLWHWPIFALLLYCGKSLEEWRWSAVAASFLMAAISYYKVEQPFRTAKMPSLPTLGRLLVAPVACIAIFLAFVHATDGMFFRFSDEAQAVIKSAAARSKYIYNGCHLSESADTSALPQLSNSLCYFGAEKKDAPLSKEADIILVGDSHAEAIRGFVEVLTADAGLRGVMITKSSTPYIQGIEFINKRGVRSTRSQQNAALAEYLAGAEAKYVVLAGRYCAALYGPNETVRPGSISVPGRTDEVLTVEEQERIFAEHFEKTVAHLVANNKIPVLIKDVPEMGSDLSNRAVFDAINGTSTAYVPKSIVTNRQKFVDSVIDTIAKKYPSVRVIDPKALICRDGNCYATLDSTPLYVDDDHLGYYGSRYLGEKYLAGNSNPFSRN